MRALLILYIGDNRNASLTRIVQLPNGLSPFIGLHFSDDYNDYEVLKVDIPLDRADGKRDYSVIITLRPTGPLPLVQTHLEGLGWE